MSKLSKADVERLAKLARLRLSEDELAHFPEEFSRILDYVELLKDVDTEGLEPTYQVNGLSTVTRPDEIIDYGLSGKELLKNVPKSRDDHIEVKRMIG